MNSFLNEDNQKKVLISSLIFVVCVVIIILWNFASNTFTRALPAGNIDITTPYSKYLLGEEVQFSLTNKYNSTVYIRNSCPQEPLDVYKQKSDGNWQQIHFEIEKKDCKDSDRLITLKPSQTINGSYARWSGLFNEAGRYRILANVEYFDELPYVDFEIINKPEIPKIPEVNQNTSSQSVNSQSGTNSASNSSSIPTASTNIDSATNDSQQSQATKTVSIDAGTVVVSIDGSYITVLSVIPNNPYTSYEGGRSGTNVEITFKGAGEMQIQLSVRNGELRVKVED